MPSASMRSKVSPAMPATLYGGGVVSLRPTPRPSKITQRTSDSYARTCGIQRVPSAPVPRMNTTAGSDSSPWLS